MTRALLSCLLGLSWTLLAAGQPPGSPPSVVDVQTVGPQVGATVPAFLLPDQTGERRSLESIMGPKGAVLVFFRSADW
jgi:hypothetical protein